MNKNTPNAKHPHNIIYHFSHTLPSFALQMGPIHHAFPNSPILHQPFALQ
jgi:hypothetical protein